MKRYYVVVNRRKPGVYSKWLGVGETTEQIEGFPKAIDKGLYTRDEAINWLKEFPIETSLKLAPNLVEYLDSETDSSPTSAETIVELLKSEEEVIFTDGSTTKRSGLCQQASE